MGLISRVSSRTYRFPLKMFDAKLQNGLNLKKCVNALKELIEQGAWDVTEDGIQMQSMDSSHVALVQMNISDTSFETFRCDQAMQMGLNMGNLFKIFGAFTNGSVHIQADGEDADTVKWVFETASDGKSKAKKNRVKEEAGSDEEEGSGDDDEMQDEGEKKKTSNKIRGPIQKKQTYELRLMDLDVEQLGIPEQDYQATFTMPSSEFTKIVKDLLIIGESVTIDVKKSSVTFKAEAIGDNDEAFELEVNDPIELSFATQYLKKFTAAGPLSRDVTIALSPDVPMVISYEVEDFGHLKYFLAPKIDDDDDE